MSDLAAAAAAMGVPEALVKRSAEARAKATGGSVEEILAAWAGGGEAPSAAASAAPAATASAGVAEQGDARRQTPDAGPEPDPALAVGQAGSVTQTSNLEPPTAAVEPPTAPGERLPVTAPPAPTEVSPKEALRYPVVVTVPTSGLTERIVPALPTWLASMLLLIPLFGLLQLFGATSNDCGQAGELLVDRVSGALVNCDGSAFEGRGTPGGSTDFIAVGEQIFTGQVVAAANCQSCHGAQGQGGVGPALTTVRSTFSSCMDHVEWVAKGTQGFQNEGRSTYGDLNKPVGGGGNMPSFAAALTPEQIGAVAAFERVRFGGVAAEEALADCGLVLPEEGAPVDGEGAAGEGEAPVENPAP
jgi:mono/diheme cytochrome c family protein